MSSAKKFSGLGRGLSALIPQKKDAPVGGSVPSPRVMAALTPVSADSRSDEPKTDRRDGRPFEIPLAAIVANPEQPRAQFRHQELEDLMNSIKEHGIIQPLTVSRLPGGGYELIAGERRFRAAKMLGLATVPVTVRSTDDSTNKLVLALIENIQREDLNALEEARAYGRLISEFGLTQDMVAKQVGKARSTVANTVRLLDLPREVQDAIAAGVVSAGSARAMLSLPDTASQLKFFRKLIAGKMSTRDAEAGVRSAGGQTRKDPAVLGDEETLRRTLGTKVEIKKRNGQGSIVISFYSDEEYGEVLGRLR
jgi:ParB family transcriptional regulator, chromosome partitioning protein